MEPANTNRKLQNSLNLFLQRALLGAITPNLRMVSVKAKEDCWEVYAFFDGSVSEDDKETMSIVETELWADVIPPHQVSLQVIQLDYPNPLPQDFERVYRRQEPYDI